MRVNICAITICCLLAGCLSGCLDSRQEAMDTLNQELAERNARRSRSQELYRKAMEAHQAGDLTAARGLLAKAVEEDESNAHAWMQLGTYQHEQGELYDAAQAFRKASHLKPERYEPHYNIGLIHESVGHWRRAIRSYELALELAPDQVEVMENLARCYIATNTKMDKAKHLIDRALESESRPEWVQWLTGQAIRLEHLGKSGLIALEPADKEREAGGIAATAPSRPQQESTEDVGPE